MLGEGDGGEVGVGRRRRRKKKKKRAAKERAAKERATKKEKATKKECDEKIRQTPTKLTTAVCKDQEKAAKAKKEKAAKAKEKAAKAKKEKATKRALILGSDRGCSAMLWVADSIARDALADVRFKVAKSVVEDIDETEWMAAKEKATKKQ